MLMRRSVGLHAPHARDGPAAEEGVCLMKTITRIALLAAAPLALAACDSTAENAAETAGDDMENAVEVQSDALENEAEAMREADPGMNSDGTEAKADAMENQAGAMREQAEDKAESMEEAAETGTATKQ
jgi:hypothetical protein